MYLRESFGKLTGFLSGWIFFIVGFSAPIAAAAMAFASYFFRVFPNALAQKPRAPFIETGIVSISPLTLFAVGIIILFSLIHCYSLYLGSRVQNFLTGFKIAIIIVFVVAGLGFGNGLMDGFFVSDWLEYKRDLTSCQFTPDYHILYVFLRSIN